MPDTSQTDSSTLYPPRLKPGVKRISLGPALYAHAMGALDEAVGALVRGDIATATTGMDSGRMEALLRRGAH